MPDTIFVHLPSEDGDHCYVSLYQIVMVTGMTEDRLTLHLSDGKSVTIHGKFVVERLTGLLALHAMTIEGEKFTDIAKDLPPEGPTLVKPADPE